jgi:glycosyltransferase involved in cell wall biosynthesis
LLQAWAIVQKKYPDWRLDVFGDGDRSAYEALIDQLGIDRSRCKLNQRTQNIQQEFERSAISVCSSRFEGFGLVIIEAMACGLPVVSFDCPCGPKDIVRHEQDGLLVPSGNIDSLADALHKLMSDDTLRQEMASKAIVNVKRFQLDEIAKQWKSLFNRVENVYY